MQKSGSLKHEPSSEPLHDSTKMLFSNRERGEEASAGMEGQDAEILRCYLS